MNKLNIVDNGKLLEIHVNGIKRGLASRTRPIDQIVRSVYHLLGNIDPSISLDLVEYKIKEVLGKGK